MSARRWLSVGLVIAGALAIVAFALSDAAPRAAPTPLVVTAVAFSSAAEIPQQFWTRQPLLWRQVDSEAHRRGIAPPSAWVRYRFDHRPGDGRFGMSSEFMREHYTIYLNGIDIYRTNAASNDMNFNWHHPIFVPLPDKLLVNGTNTIVFRLQSVADRPLSVGFVSVGPDAALRDATNRQIMLESTALQIINGVLAILTLGTLLFWVVRPQERVFGWLALVGTIWWFRNLHYFIANPPFDNDLFWILTTDSIFVLLAVVYGFAATFFDLPNRRKVIALVFAACGLAIIARHLLVAAGHSDSASFLLTIPVALATLYLLARACIRAPRAENILMFVAVAIATGFAFHDLMMSVHSPFTIGVYLQPYGSLLVFSAFGFALGRRMLVALAVNEDVNAMLERRVAVATAELERSEASRRELQVASAIENERERMMREIHDGIGSSLITALAVAERQLQSPGTIATLKRSITDLRIGVDSLEPIEGDVVALLASLRHRMERELASAGLAFVWQVESVPPLAWLDAVAALHVLRILQEAISNVLAHAGASLIEVGCAASMHCGASGVLITITDNGCGFDPETVAGGRGVANMHARAEALHAVLDCRRRHDASGMTISLWLPEAAPKPAILQPR